MANSRTARLRLRPWRDADVAAFEELNADPEVMEFLLVLPDWADRARAHWETHGFGQWVVEIPGTASFIGVVGLNNISYPAHFTPAVEIAWRLARAYWGRGYATEATTAIRDHVFESGCADRLMAVCRQLDDRSTPGLAAQAVVDGLGVEFGKVEVEIRRLLEIN